VNKISIENEELTYQEQEAKRLAKQRAYNKELESTRNGIILKAFQFFLSLDYLKNEDVVKFEQMFNKKQQKHIDKVMEL
jgi:hypothetical protein